MKPAVSLRGIKFAGANKKVACLGVKSIALQNQCLLLKLIHKLHSPMQSVWACWVWAQHNSEGLDASV